jgi:hypothetical protein
MIRFLCPSLFRPPWVEGASSDPTSVVPAVRRFAFIRRQYCSARFWHAANGITATAGAVARRAVEFLRRSRFGRFAPFPEFREGGWRERRVMAGKLLFKLGLAAPIQRLLLHQKRRSDCRYLTSGCGSLLRTRGSASPFSWPGWGAGTRDEMVLSAM